MVQERIDPWFPVRINTIFVFVLIGFVALGVRLYMLHVRNFEFYHSRAVDQQTARTTIPARRGTIYDVNGMSIAASRKSKTICLVPGQVNRKVDSVRLLSSALDVDPDVIRDRMASGKHLVYIPGKRKVDDLYAEQIAALKIPGIVFQEEADRVYPNTTLFSHIVGFAGVDNRGLEGLELYYDSLLNGRPGFQEVNRNALSSSAAFINAEGRYRPAEDGCDIYLTLDGYIQGVTETVLLEIQEQYRPDSISAVAVDPNNGRILAMANMPCFAPSRYGSFTADERRNRAVTDVCEPGSIMKVFTAAAAIEQGVNPDTQIFDCENGLFYYKGRTLHDHHPYDELNLRDVIVFSSNIGAAKIGIYLGPETVYDYLDRFGFGGSTGITFPSEGAGYLRPLRTWDAFTLTSVPMGHEITATPLQVVMAMAALINGGTLYKPQIIDRIVNAEGRVVQAFAPEPVAQVIDPRTSAVMREIMAEVVERGTARKARLNDVRIGGKTGTAQLLVTDPVTGVAAYSETAYMASFCGFAPVDAPKLCIIIAVCNPKGDIYYGGSVAAPGLRTIVSKTLKYVSQPVLTYRETRQP